MTNLLKQKTAAGKLMEFEMVQHVANDIAHRKHKATTRLPCCVNWDKRSCQAFSSTAPPCSCINRISVCGAPLTSR